MELYTCFSSSGINVAQHLENFVDEPLKYYAAETTDIFLHALGNAFKSNTVIFQVDDARACKTDLSDDEKPYDYTLYFARSGNHLNAVLVVPKTSMNEGHDDESHGGESHDEVDSGDISAETSKCCTDSDSDLEIITVIPGNGIDVSKTIVKTEKQDCNTTQEDLEITAIIPGSDLSEIKVESEKPDPNTGRDSTAGRELSSDSDDKNSEDVVEDDIDEPPSLKSLISKPEESVKILPSGKTYIKESWDKIKKVKCTSLPYDVDGNQAFILPLDKTKRFKNSKDGRHWTNIRESRKSNFSGDRYMATCRGSFECSNIDCPHVIQYRKFNKRQFTPKGICKSCGAKCERVQCTARKFWEFGEKEIVVKHYGDHTCSPVKHKKESQMKSHLQVETKKVSLLRKDILSDMIKEGKDLRDIEETADQLLDRKKLVNMKSESQKTSDFEKLDELREKYKKKDKLLIYRMNSRSHSNQPTFVFKTSDVACSVGRNMGRDGDHLMSQSYAFFDGNEKRVRNMTTYTLSVYHFLLRRQVVLATMDCEAENQGNAEMFFKT